MTFVNDSAEVLEVTSEVAITKQAVSFFGFKIKGDYSINFTVDNNSINRDVLNYHGPQMLNQIAFTRQPFTLMRDGNPFIRGAIVIQEDNGKNLNCYFVSGNSNWINLLQGLITELDYTGLTNGIEYAGTLQAFDFYSTVSSTSGIIWPQCDFAYNLNKGSNYYGQQISDSSGTVFFDLFPAFYLFTLVEEITKQNSIKISGNILTEKLYKTLIIPPSSATMERPTGQTTIGYGSTQVISNVYSTYTSITRKSDPEGVLNLNGDGHLYTCNQYALFRVYISITCVEPTTVRILDSSGSTTDNVINGNTDVYDSSHKLIPGNSDQTYLLLNTTQRSGFYFDIQVKANTATTPNFRINQLTVVIDKVLGGSDIFYPNYFLPELKSVDIIKFLVSSFGCSCYYNEFSKTLSLNIIENLKEENAYDWSEFYISHRVEYTVEQAANNYMRLEDAQESQITAYNKKNNPLFGEANILSSNELKDNNDLYNSPFSPSFIAQNKNTFWECNIPLVSLTDEGDAIPFTSIVSGGGKARFTGAAGAFSNVQIGNVVRIVSGGNDIGYHIVDNATSTYIECASVYFTITNTGNIYRQKGQNNKINPRILVVKPNTNVSDMSDQAQMRTSIYTPTAVPFATFVKPLTSQPIDSFRGNAAYGNPIGAYYDPSITELYFKKITKILNNPTVRAQMLIPESNFQSFYFDQFIYLKTETLDGYFFVDSIVNYKDGNTPVEVNLYML
jgi:hypothetical protein